MRVFVSVVVIVVWVSSAAADKLAAFKESDRYEEGCVTIPVTYSSERDACNSEGPKVHTWCDGAKGPVTCFNEEATKRPKREIEAAKRNIAELKNKKEQAERNKSNATSDEDKKKYSEEIERLDKELYEANKALEAAERALELRRKHVEDAIYTLDQCIGYRRAVMNSFAYALDKMRNENETPEIKAVASSLVKKYERSKSGHEEQITARTNAWKNCKDWMP